MIIRLLNAKMAARAAVFASSSFKSHISELSKGRHFNSDYQIIPYEILVNYHNNNYQPLSLPDLLIITVP